MYAAKKENKCCKYKFHKFNKTCGKKNGDNDNVLLLF